MIVKQDDQLLEILLLIKIVREIIGLVGCLTRSVMWWWGRFWSHWIRDQPQPTHWMLHHRHQLVIIITITIIKLGQECCWNILTNSLIFSPFLGACCCSTACSWWNDWSWFCLNSGNVAKNILFAVCGQKLQQMEGALSVRLVFSCVVLYLIVLSILLYLYCIVFHCIICYCIVLSIEYEIRAGHRVGEEN